MSLPPPAAKPTTMRIVLFGSSLCAAAGVMTPSAITALAMNKDRRVAFIFPLPLFSKPSATRSARRATPSRAQPFHHCLGHRFRALQSGEVTAPWNLHQPRAGNACRHFIGKVRRRRDVFRADQDQRRTPDRLEQRARIRTTHDRLLLTNIGLWPDLAAHREICILQGGVVGALRVDVKRELRTDDFLEAPALRERDVRATLFPR